MLKIGIYAEAQDTPTQRIWRRGSMAASLLSAGDPTTPAYQDRFERLMPDLCLSSGVARTTARGRFAELNETIGECLRTIFPSDSALVVEDWAVSSGITAAEWFTRLLADYPRLKFTASDWVLFLIEASRTEARDTYILEPDGTPVQYIRPPFVVSLTQPQHWLYALNRRLQQQALRTWNDELASKFRIPADWDGLVDADAPVSMPPFVLRRLPLLHPEAKRLRSEQFQIRRHSVFEALDRPVHVVRTMNILNRAYFSDTQLQAAATAVEASLQTGGMWIVGRTRIENPPQHDVTVYRKQPSGWKVLLRVGAGSEMEPLIKCA